jgi:spore coat protein U-like protein
MPSPFRILVAAALAGLAPLAMAAESAEIRVSATVINTCKITSTEDIAFGQLDPSAATDVTAEGAVTFKCTKNADYTVSVDHGSNWDGTAGKRQMKSGGKDVLPYALAESSFSGKGSGFTTPIRLALRASLAGAAYRDLPADAYTDTLRVSINP